MKKVNLFRALSFALFAGLGTLPWLLLWAPWVGYSHALASYALGLAVVGTFAYAPSLRAGLTSGSLAALVLVPFALIGPSPSSAMLAGLAMLGIGRSGVCYRRPFARALAIELTLALCAIILVSVVYDASLFGCALAVWAFWLVQSVFSLVPGRAELEGEAHGDAFETARAAADRLMSTQ